MSEAFSRQSDCIQRKTLQTGCPFQNCLFPAGIRLFCHEDTIDYQEAGGCSGFKYHCIRQPSESYDISAFVWHLHIRNLLPETGLTMKPELDVNVSVERLGVALEPNGHFSESAGIINPATARDRQGQLLIYPRMVAQGNVSRIGLVRAIQNGQNYLFERLGFALEPESLYELRNGGHGCEDPRVTFIPVLDKYIMGYTAYGAEGPRIAFAWSADGYQWQRIGVARFPEELGLAADDKDIAFFPEPVISPAGVRSIAFYHRPMNEIVPGIGQSMIQAILSSKPHERQCIRIAYVPLAAVLQDLNNITKVSASVMIMAPDDSWGQIKLGGGTAPVRIQEGWLSLFHGVDMEEQDGNCTRCYRSGVVIHDLERPHQILYRSPSPILAPTTDDELQGTVNNVVFPTGLDRRTDLEGSVFDVFYGMADYKIGLARMKLVIC